MCLLIFSLSWTELRLSKSDETAGKHACENLLDFVLIYYCVNFTNSRVVRWMLEITISEIYEMFWIYEYYIIKH